MPLTDDHKQMIIARLSWLGFGFKALAMIFLLFIALAYAALEHASLWAFASCAMVGFWAIDRSYLNAERNMRDYGGKSPQAFHIYYPMLFVVCLIVLSIAMLQ